MKEIFIPPHSQQRLLQVSRRTLKNFVAGSGRQAEEHDDPYLHSRDYGAFVSLHKGESLRGCIGTCAPREPLYQTVIEMTEAAASRDQRVEPIAEAELSEIRIDISVLSPLEAVNNPLALEVGRHGLYVAKRSKRGVLLPQVATEHNWDIRTFIEQTCLKAGLPKDAWKEPSTRISSFTALIIEESP